MNWKQIVNLGFWAIFSVCASAFFSFIGFVFFALRTMDLHKNSSMPGDFAEVDASLILDDILVNWGITFPFVCLIAWGGYQVTKGYDKEFSTLSNRRYVTRFLYGLFVFNVLLICAVLLWSGVDYWQERAPYFAK